MFRKPVQSLMIALSLAALAACGSSPYTPVATKGEPIDATVYTKKVNSFVVLLDTSGSMKTEDAGRARIYTAEDFVASFNSAVPPLDYEAGLVIFGKGSSSACTGYGVAKTLYGLEPYSSADFASALGSIKCAASTTPIADAIDSATGMLTEETGPIAVIIVSDFNWNDPAAVEASIAALKAAHPNNICLHTVKIGDDTAHDALISSLTTKGGCDSAVGAGDIATGAAMNTYVENTLLTALDKPLHYERHTVSAQALFDFDKSILKPQGKAELQNLGREIKSQGLKVGDIDVVGHTDNIGTDAYNQGLSERRAKAVRDYLVSEGVNPAIIDSMGMGERDPVASNDTEAGRAMNRRVDVMVGTSRPTE